MYDRDKAVAYAHKWAYGRNPAYADFSAMGGDCTNFLSQCLHAGGLPMVYRPVTGWCYASLSYRSPAWTGVQPFYDFMTGRQKNPPYARDAVLADMQPGDVIQLSFDGGNRFSHGFFVVEVGSPLSENTILGATHTENSDNRPLSHWIGAVYRCLHILD